MKFIKLVTFIALIALIIPVLAACGKNPATPVVVETQAVTQGPSTAETPAAGEPTSKPSGVPDDIPIMPDATDLQVPNQLNVSYKVNATIQDVATFYQTELPNFGWTTINNPDSVVGSMAQLSRSNDAGDRLIFSIQYNSIAEFSVIQIYITRAP